MVNYGCVPCAVAAARFRSLHFKYDDKVQQIHSVRSRLSVRLPCVTPRGEAVVIRKAVCIHEEDTGILWKHVSTTMHGSVRQRNRSPTVSHARSCNSATVPSCERLAAWCSRGQQAGQPGCVSCR